MAQSPDRVDAGSHHEERGVIPEVLGLLRFAVRGEIV
jgi:hypothetical protein